jgi:hypothetical protein
MFSLALASTALDREFLELVVTQIFDSFSSVGVVDGRERSIFSLALASTALDREFRTISFSKRLVETKSMVKL